MGEGEFSPRFARRNDVKKGFLWIPGGGFIEPPDCEFGFGAKVLRADSQSTRPALKIDGKRETENACVPVLGLRSPVIFIDIRGPPSVGQRLNKRLRR
jgi:hypothetical protein